MGGRTGKTQPSIKDGDRYSSLPPRVARFLRNNLLIESSAKQMDFLSAAAGVSRNRRPAWSARSTLPPAGENGNIVHQRPGGANTVVCCQRRGDWCLGPRAGSVSRWMRTTDAKSGAFHLAGTPCPPRSHFQSTDDR